MNFIPSLPTGQIVNISQKLRSPLWKPVGLSGGSIVCLCTRGGVTRVHKLRYPLWKPIGLSGGSSVCLCTRGGIPWMQKLRPPLVEASRAIWRQYCTSVYPWWGTADAEIKVPPCGSQQGYQSLFQGVFIPSNTTMDKRVTNICRSAYAELWRIGLIRHLLTVKLSCVPLFFQG